jgi:hypothetical protein
VSTKTGLETTCVLIALLCSALLFLRQLARVLSPPAVALELLHPPPSLTPVCALVVPSPGHACAPPRPLQLLTHRLSSAVDALWRGRRG